MEEQHQSTFAFERVPLSYKHGELSPGSIFGNRIAIGAEEERDLFWASATHLHRLSLDPAPTATEFVPNYSGKMLLPPPADRGGRSVVIESKNGAPNHQAEVQNLCVVTSGASQRLYSVDTTGRVLIHHFDGLEQTHTSVLEPSSALGDVGWVGVSAHASMPSVCATARYWDKLVTVYSEDRIISRFKTMGHPMQMQLLDNGMLAMTEQGSYSIWDLRLPHSVVGDLDLPKHQFAGVGSSGACVQRMYVSSDPLYAMDIMGTKLAVAGAERSCVVFDIRGEGAEARWNNCLKYDVTRLRFSRSNPALCYVSGLDNELLVGRWDGSIGLSHFDGPHIESHWIGISNNNATDTIYGLAQSGHMYICKNVPSLLDNVHSANRRSNTNSPRPSLDGSMPSVIPHQRQAKKKKTTQPPAKKKQKTEESE